MTHLTEEDIVLHYYGEETSLEAAEHLSTCSECRGEAERLERVLNLVRIDYDEPGEDFEEQTWSRLRWRLRGEQGKGRRSWGAVAAVAAVLIVAVLSGLWLSRPQTVRPDQIADTPNVTAPTPHRERVLVVVVNDHLDRTERVLLELTHLDAEGQVGVESEQRSADSLVGANRLYRRIAADRDPKLRALLEEIEPILLEIARSSGTMEGEDLRALQRRIDETNLIFKLRVSGTRERNQSRTAVPST